MKMQRFVPVRRHRRGLLATVAAVVLSLLAVQVFADSVGQKMNAKYFAPETVQLLQSRALAGTPGFQLGDSVNYIIEFAPINNGSTVGINGYVTDYIPAGTEVIGASFVVPDGSGGFTTVAPDLPGEAPDGWGNRGQGTFAAPFNTNAYDTTGKCAAFGKTNNCDGSIAMLYADTGIWYSTVTRTALYVAPDVDGRARQGTNGYNINPTGASNLNTLLGQAKDTTHNLWDADQTNAFGSTAGAIAALAAPKSLVGSLTSGAGGNDGKGPTPFNVGSAVAGPLTGYQLDNTAAAGPWQRIAYAGSRIGTNTVGPATSYGGSGGNVGSTSTIVGSPTSAGFNLSGVNPLPSGTNAVRWAVGRLVVGQTKYVKINLRLTALPPANGLINNCEVFGGDVAELFGKNGKDSPWRYNVPSVCTSTSSLYLVKQIIKVNGVPSNGAVIPANAKLTYRLTYLNTSAIAQTNVVLSDTLPAQTGSNPLSNLVFPSGPNLAPTIPNPLGTVKNFQFQPIASLAPGAGGVVEFDVQTTAATGDVVTNKACLKSTENPTGVCSQAVSNVVNTSNLIIQKKSELAHSGIPGSIVTYTINVTNTGAAAASNIVLYDFLPTMGGACCLNAARINFVPGSSVFSGAITAVTPITVSPPTIVPYVGTNREQLTWTFTGQTLAPGAGFSVRILATIGGAMLNGSYVNDTTVVYNNGQANASALTPVTSGATAVTVSSFEATSTPALATDGTLAGLSLAGILALGGVALLVWRKR
ncbi:MAG: hypothetical protein HZB53_08495 [Chloroflexi bacterium]|nr:hypothetical protein [Chloroflexota bacterium]